MKTVKWLFISIVPLLLVACDNQETTTMPTLAQLPTSEPLQAVSTDLPPTQSPVTQQNIEPTTAGPTNTPFIGYRGSVNGSEQLELIGRGVVQCLPLSPVELLQITHEVTDTNVIELRIPRGLSLGSYPVNQPDTGITLQYINSAGETFDTLPAGQVILNGVPEEIGDPVLGNFSLRVMNEDGSQIINLLGQFNFQADETSFSQCNQ